ncbi:hypothetical protein [Croceicoccus mobilis]|uniref:Uncharacterized protein n=1 Tax=Croceicoccus mobilis TaxID=1703339 RepID=A0A917DWB1_9SPHN|nr:hypothetical protein [Croceicoccus mobilis]GGD73808.1 hypothetical protein GCM10010990_24280 [Croceicoccus mobilis]
MSVIIISWIFRRLLKAGVPEEWADRLAKPLLIAGLVLLGIVCAIGAVQLHDRGVIDDYEKDRAIASIEATDKAAEQRARDEIENFKQEQEMRDAIDAAPESDVPLHPAISAAVCLQLRPSERERTPACRSAGGDGAGTRSIKRSGN